MYNFLILYTYLLKMYKKRDILGYAEGETYVIDENKSDEEIKSAIDKLQIYQQVKLKK